jgi:hypothetical protein
MLKVNYFMSISTSSAVGYEGPSAREIEAHLEAWLRTHYGIFAQVDIDYQEEDE